jgi:hypothetical protein
MSLGNTFYTIFSRSHFAIGYDFGIMNQPALTTLYDHRAISVCFTFIFIDAGFVYPPFTTTFSLRFFCTKTSSPTSFFQSHTLSRHPFPVSHIAHTPRQPFPTFCTSWQTPRSNLSSLRLAHSSTLSSTALYSNLQVKVPPPWTPTTFSPTS